MVKTLIDDISLSVNLASVELKNPVIPASGTFGYGVEYKDLYDLNLLGAVVTKSVTKEERYGNVLPRIAECTSGMLNSIGLQNPGVEEFEKSAIPELRKFYAGPIIGNISGFSVDEYSEVAAILDRIEDIAIIEVNISCPNVEEGGVAFGSDPFMSETITAAVKSVTSKPVFVKLTPNVTDIVSIAKACEAGGADGISLINNFRAMRIDIKNRKTVTGMKYAGLSGPAIKPVALRMVNEVYHAVDLPIMGIGGISCADDVIEMIMAGATAVQIGTANLINPWVCADIIKELPDRMMTYGIQNFEEIRGVV